MGCLKWEYGLSMCNILSPPPPNLEGGGGGGVISSEHAQKLAYHV